MKKQLKQPLKLKLLLKKILKILKQLNWPLKKQLVLLRKQKKLQKFKMLEKISLKMQTLKQSTNYLKLYKKKKLLWKKSSLNLKEPKNNSKKLLKRFKIRLQEKLRMNLRILLMIPMPKVPLTLMLKMHSKKPLMPLKMETSLKLRNNLKMLLKKSRNKKEI